VEVLKENPEDEFGELVITHLCNLSAPLIRYRIQDLAIPAGLEEECTYGLGLHSLRAVVGRQHDLIRLSSGRVVHGEFFTHIFDHMKGVKRFQVIQRRPDAFEISIVKGFGYGDSQEQFLRARIHEHLGSVEVRIRYASSIQGEASGKFRWVKSEVERQDDQYPTISRAD
jgi:phenylacetate-CoA ligase